MKRVNAFHGPAIDAYIVPDTDEHQVIICKNKYVKNNIPT